MPVLYEPDCWDAHSAEYEEFAREWAEWQMEVYQAQVKEMMDCG